jgi:hypothetical protein
MDAGVCVRTRKLSADLCLATKMQLQNGNGNMKLANKFFENVMSSSVRNDRKVDR